MGTPLSMRACARVCHAGIADIEWFATVRRETLVNPTDLGVEAIATCS